MPRRICAVVLALLLIAAVPQPAAADPIFWPIQILANLLLMLVSENPECSKHSASRIAEKECPKKSAPRPAPEPARPTEQLQS